MFGRVGRRGREGVGVASDPAAMLVRGLENGAAVVWCGLRTVCILCSPCINWVIPALDEGGWSRLEESICGWEVRLCIDVAPDSVTVCCRAGERVGKAERELPRDGGRCVEGWDTERRPPTPRAGVTEGTVEVGAAVDSWDVGVAVLGGRRVGSRRGLPERGRGPPLPPVRVLWRSTGGWRGDSGGRILEPT